MQIRQNQQIRLQQQMGYGGYQFSPFNNNNMMNSNPYMHNNNMNAMQLFSQQRALNVPQQQLHQIRNDSLQANGSNSSNAIGTSKDVINNPYISFSTNTSQQQL